MKTRGGKKRERLFRIYSNNLQLVKGHDEIKMEPDFDEGYICPICFEVYDKSHLEKTNENPLTLEDIPPKALGGKQLALTCQKCNSFCGHELDVHLVNRLIELDAHQLSSNSKFKTTFEKDGNRMGGMINIDENRTIKLDFRREWSNPKEAKEFLNNLFPPIPINLNPEIILRPEPKHTSGEFSMTLPSRSDERRAEIALLKSAYLYAFAKYGYSFLINGSLYKIREQILNPEKQILSKVFWIKYKFPKECLGLNLICEPKELRCYLIIFEMETKSKKYQFAIALPGPSDPGLKIYENIERLLCQGENEAQNCDLEHVPELKYITNKDLIWASHIHWQIYCQKKK